MKNILIVTLGLAVGLLVGAGIIYIAQKNEDKTAVNPENQPTAAKEAPVTLTSLEQELQKRLAEGEEARNKLQSRIVSLQRELAEIKENGQAQSATRENALNEKATKARENMRRYARAILAMEGNSDALGNDPTLQTAFQEMMADMMKLMAKHNINFDMFGGDAALYKTYGVPEIRQWFSQLGAAMFEELGAPLSESQLQAVDAAMLRTAEEGKNLDDPSLTRLEKAIAFQKFKAKQGDEFRDIFTDEQEKRFPEDIATAMIGMNPDSISLRAEAAGTTRDECAAIISQKWGSELKLNDTQKPGVKYVADMYVNEYAMYKTGAEAEYGKEFMDYYLERYDRSDKDASGAWRKSKWQYFENPENKRKQDALNLRFAELQLKYQKQLSATFPDKQEQIKAQRPQITSFPYLEQ